MERDYSSVSIPKVLLEKIEELIKEGKCTYTSRSEFIKTAIREKLEKYDVTT